MKSLTKKVKKDLEQVKKSIEVIPAAQLKSVCGGDQKLQLDYDKQKHE